MFPLIVSPTCTGLTEKQKTLVGEKPAVRTILAFYLQFSIL